MTTPTKVPPFPAVVEFWTARGKLSTRYHEKLAALNNRSASGCYAIIDASSKAVLYVGESHTGRLYDTITRHFRKWKRATSYGRPSGTGGTTYDRESVLVTYTLTRADEAQDRQYLEIQRLSPRDNQIDGQTVVDGETPF